MSVRFFDEVRAVPPFFRPIAAVIAVSSRRVGESNDDGQRCRCADVGCYHVLLRMADGRHGDLLAAGRESRIDLAVPQVEFLSNVVDFVRCETVESDDSEMEAVRVDAIPVRGSLPTVPFVELYGVGFGVSAPEIVVAQRFGECVIGRIGETMPSPLALCSERYAVAVVFRKCLQTRSIDRAGESAVAYRKRSERIEPFDDRIVAGHERFTVDRRKRLRAG